MTFDDPRVPAAFWKFVVPEPNSGCWLFLRGGTIDGYGSFQTAKGKTVAAHRFILKAEGRCIEGLVIDHRCEIKMCVNPDHLDAVTRAVNTRRFYKKHIHWTILNKLGFWRASLEVQPGRTRTGELTPPNWNMQIRQMLDQPDDKEGSIAAPRPGELIDGDT